MRLNHLSRLTTSEHEARIQTRAPRLTLQSWRFLWLLHQITTKWVASCNTSVFSHSFRGQNAAIKVLAGLCSLQSHEKRVLSSLFQLLVAPGILWFVQHNSTLSPSLHMAVFPVCCVPLSSQGVLPVCLGPNVPLLTRTRIILDEGPTLLQYDLILT